MSQHTKGPWRVLDHSVTPGCVSVIGESSVDFVAGSVLPADARLIALAPEMLDCLKALEWVSDDELERRFCPECDNLQRLGHTPACRLGNILTKMEGV